MKKYSIAIIIISGFVYVYLIAMHSQATSGTMFVDYIRELDEVKNLRSADLITAMERIEGVNSAIRINVLIVGTLVFINATLATVSIFRKPASQPAML